MDPNLYEYRPLVDLSNPRLRMLARALGLMFEPATITFLALPEANNASCR